MEVGSSIRPLMQAGVQLVTANDGAVNGNPFAARVAYRLKEAAQSCFRADAFVPDCSEAG